ncbi:MAG TPA: GNAT family N-acetyltransferase [Candidatus Eisenbacteria bacterium]|nr:GNAT family N-acetyltransferase [Candidatus Eisenbacteria bacterium]
MTESPALNLKRVTYADDPTIRTTIFQEVKVPAWPEFMFHDPLANELWHYLQEEFAEYQFIYRDEAGKTIAVGHTLPFHWDRPLDELPETGWDGIFRKVVDDYLAGRKPNMMTAIEATIIPSQRGTGLSKRVIGEMRAMAEARGFETLVAPVRPSMKSRYPTTPIERYVAWKTDDGFPFDPWLRTHARLGAKIVKIAHESMRIPGPVADWETWTKMQFPESGEYIVPGALVPVTVNRERDEAVYVEPNVWMAHGV